MILYVYRELKGGKKEDETYHFRPNIELDAEFQILLSKVNPSGLIEM